jgi:hypothetical protein
MSQSRKDALVRWMLNTFADPGAPCPDLPGLTRGEFEDAQAEVQQRLAVAMAAAQARIKDKLSHRLSPDDLEKLDLALQDHFASVLTLFPAG